MINNRDDLRVPAALVCRFDYEDGVQDGFLLNISSEGLGTTSNVPLKRGTTKDLLFLPANMQVPAKVIWCQEEKNGYSVGWRFLENAPELISIVRKLEAIWKTLQK